MENKHIIINIGRQFGSGGKATAEELGRILGIPVYDGELLTEAAKKSGIRKELFTSSDEKHRFNNIYCRMLEYVALVINKWCVSCRFSYSASKRKSGASSVSFRLPPFSSYI